MNKIIAHITDIHLDEQFPKDYGADAAKNWTLILADVSSKNISNVVFGGDIGSLESNKSFFNSLEDFNLDITLGNHDKASEVRKHFDNAHLADKEEMYYAKEDAYFKYIFLDSSEGQVSDKQFKWLSKEVSSSKCLIVFIHHPIIPLDTEADRQFALKDREKLLKLLKSLNSDVIIFCGHYHMSDYAQEGNVKQYITPASSVQVIKDDKSLRFDGKTFGYRLIELQNSDVITKEVLL